MEGAQAEDDHGKTGEAIRRGSGTGRGMKSQVRSEEELQHVLIRKVRELFGGLDPRRSCDSGAVEKRIAGVLGEWLSPLEGQGALEELETVLRARRSSVQMRIPGTCASLRFSFSHGCEDRAVLMGLGGSGGPLFCLSFPGEQALLNVSSSFDEPAPPCHSELLSMTKGIDYGITIATRGVAAAVESRILVELQAALPCAHHPLFQHTLFLLRLIARALDVTMVFRTSRDPASRRRSGNKT